MTIKRRLILPIVMMAIVVFLGSCSSTKDVAYIQNSSSVNFDSSQGLYDARIMPKDILTITVSTEDPRRQLRLTSQWRLR